MTSIGAVWKKDPAWMKQPLVNWYGAMQAEGLTAEGANVMEQFIRHGVQGKGLEPGAGGERGTAPLFGSRRASRVDAHQSQR